MNNNRYKTSINTLICTLLLVFATSLYAQDIPSDLSKWKPWVQYQQEFNNCPFFYNQNNQVQSSHVCAWPSELNLSINNNTAVFEIYWEIIQDSWVPLPGDVATWPQNVSINGIKQIVQKFENQPRIFLKKGSYTITGNFSFVKRPENLTIPQEIADIDLSIDNKAITFVQRRGGSLWLGENTNTKKIESDKTEFEVNRLIVDDHPMTMFVTLSLYVSGTARNEKLGKIGNKLLQVTGVDGDISAYIDNEGYLWAQLKPGNWEINMSFNILNWPNEITFQAQGKNWPKQEIWAYQDNKNIRLTQIKGVNPINPEQANSKWDKVPNYLVNSGDVFEINETKRGTLNQSAQLNLNRTLWLGFDGKSYRSKDQISGEKLGSWRLDSIDGYYLLNAKNHSENMLITQSETGTHGLELRTPNINLVVNGEFDSTILENINPWQANFESINTTLYLPHGYMPFAVNNVDSSRGVWIEKWKLWDIFIVMLLTVFCYKIVGLKAATIALTTLILGYHELNMPLIAWTNVVMVTALLAVMSKGKLKSIIRSYAYMSVVGLLIVLAPFLINQVRLSLYPQLETNYSSIGNFSQVKSSKVSKPKRARMNELNKSYSQTYNNIVAQKQIVRQEIDSAMELSEVTVTGSRLRKSDMVNRYQTGAILQAGKGVPHWKTNGINLQWDGPIGNKQKYSLYLISPTMRIIWRILLVISSVYWLFLLLQKLKSSVNNKQSTVSTSKVTTSLIFLSVFIFSNNVIAQHYPPNELLAELKGRINPQAECKNNCASINSSVINVDASKITMQLSYHAFEDVIVSIPYSVDWHVDKILINGSIQSTKINHQNIPWIKINQGINTVNISGTLANRNNISIQFPIAPGIINAKVNRWRIAGIDGNVLSNNTLQLISTRQDSESNEQSKSTDIKPFVNVTRSLTFDDNWFIKTTVTRVAPIFGVINVSIPLIDNEHPTDKIQHDDKGNIIVNLDSMQNSYVWNSRLDKTDEIHLKAANTEQYLETWEILSSPQWNIDLSGLTIVAPKSIFDNMDDYFVHTYKPRGDESLKIKVSRPKPVKGEIVSIENVVNVYTIGKRATKVNTSISYRATQGGNFQIKIDEHAKINSVSYDGVESNLTNDKGIVEVSFLPGAHKVVIDWQLNKNLDIINHTPFISLENNYTNIQQRVNLPRSLWVLYGHSKGFGPAFLYWGEFIFFTLLAFFLARIPYSPLKFWQWLLLGYAFGTVSWLAFGAVTFWLFFIGWKTQNPSLEKNYKTILLQWGSVLFTLIALPVFIGSVAYGLLSYPSMGIIGQGSSANSLNWYLDTFQNQIPTITIISVPIWWYKAVMLVWSIWVSFSLLNWLKMLINSLDKNLWWKKWNKKVKTKTIANKVEEIEENKKGQ